MTGCVRRCQKREFRCGGQGIRTPWMHYGMRSSSCGSWRSWFQLSGTRSSLRPREGFQDELSELRILGTTAAHGTLVLHQPTAPATGRAGGRNRRPRWHRQGVLHGFARTRAVRRLWGRTGRGSGLLSRTAGTVQAAQGRSHPVVRQSHCTTHPQVCWWHSARPHGYASAAHAGLESQLGLRLRPRVAL